MVKTSKTAVSLGSLSHCWAVLKVKKFPFVSNMNVSLPSLWPLSHFLPPHSWKSSGSISLVTSLKRFERLLLKPTWLQVLSLSLITQGKVSHCLHPKNPLLNTLSFVDVFLLIRGQKLNKVLWIWSNEWRINWCLYLGHGPVHRDQGIVGLLCWLRFILLLTIGFPELLPACLCATCCQYRNSSAPGLALHACPCSNSQDCYKSIPLACPDFFGCVPNPQHMHLSPLSLVLSTHLMSECALHCLLQFTNNIRHSITSWAWERILLLCSALAQPHL